MATTLAECSRCPDIYVARKRAGETCPPCRVHARMELAAMFRQRQCKGCRAKFKPIDKHDGDYCGPCEALNYPGGPQVECAVCETTGLGVYPEVRLCGTCARDPKLRTTVMEALTRGRTARIKTLSTTEAQENRVLELWRDREQIAAAHELLTEWEAAKRGRR